MKSSRSARSTAQRHDRRGQRGSALILFLGVGAALAVMSVALLMLVLNTQANTSREGMRTKAFDVAESALDVAMMELARQWPTSSEPTAFKTAEYRNNFRATFDASEFPDPATPGASFVSVSYFDDEISSNPYDYGPNGPNGRLIVDAQAVVGDNAARIRLEVEAVYYPVNLGHRLAVWAGVGIEGNSDLAIGIYGYPPSGDAVAWACRGLDPDNPPDVDEDLALLVMPLLTGNEAPTREEVLSTPTIEGLVQLAKDQGRYFGVDDYGQGAENVFNDAASAWAAAGTRYNHEGLIVIDAPGPSTSLDLGHAGTVAFNTRDKPGILMIMNRRDPTQAADLRLLGNTDYWGLVYTQGDVLFTGTQHIYGMLVAEGMITSGGTGNVLYDDSVLNRLSTTFLTNTRRGSSGWRELRPEPTRAP
jgi:hypothetical protein